MKGDLWSSFKTEINSNEQEIIGFEFVAKLLLYDISLFSINMVS